MEKRRVYCSDNPKNVNPKYKTPLLLSILPVASTIYLIWWDKLGIYSGVYELERETDYLAIVAGGILAVSCIVSLLLSFFNRIHLWMLLPALVFGVYMLRLVHGPRLLNWRDCDMSICDRMELYRDGTYYYRRSSQINTLTRSGKYLIQNDTLYLDPSQEERSRIRNDRQLLKNKGTLIVKSDDIHGRGNLSLPKTASSSTRAAGLH